MQILEILEMWLVRRQNHFPQHMEKSSVVFQITLWSQPDEEISPETQFYFLLYTCKSLFTASMRQVNTSAFMNERLPCMTYNWYIICCHSCFPNTSVLDLARRGNKRYQASLPGPPTLRAVQQEVRGSALWGPYAVNGR